MSDLTIATSTTSNGSRSYFQAPENTYDLFGDLVTYAPNTLATSVTITPPQANS